MKCLISLHDLAADSSLDSPHLDLEEVNSLDSLPLDLVVVDSKVSRHLEEDSNKVVRHLHRHRPTRHKTHLHYLQLILVRLEAASIALPLFG
jgi:hypothetical protein